MATIMAGGSENRISGKNDNPVFVVLREDKRSEVAVMSRVGLFVLSFRSGDPPEAAAHRKEGGGCFQLSSRKNKHFALHGAE